MSLFIKDAYAQAANTAPQGGSGLLMNLLPFIVVFVLMYFLLIRPQTKRAKEHRKMVEALAVGDEIVTNGGMLGKVTKVEEQFLTVEIAQGVEIKLQRQAVGQVLPKGTMKSA